MYTIVATNKFKKDFKLCMKRGLSVDLSEAVIFGLEKDGIVPSNLKLHLLKGNFKGFWECHIQPDWFLIWQQGETVKLISLTRTGTHSDLF
jgi:mRNA interferase YafQ